jgi:hypothetical protein
MNGVVAIRRKVKSPNKKDSAAGAPVNIYRQKTSPSLLSFEQACREFFKHIRDKHYYLQKKVNEQTPCNFCFHTASSTGFCDIAEHDIVSTLGILVKHYYSRPISVPAHSCIEPYRSKSEAELEVYKLPCVPICLSEVIHYAPSLPEEQKYINVFVEMDPPTGEQWSKEMQNQIADVFYGTLLMANIHTLIYVSMKVDTSDFRIPLTGLHLQTQACVQLYQLRQITDLFLTQLNKSDIQRGDGGELRWNYDIVDIRVIQKSPHLRMNHCVKRRECPNCFYLKEKPISCPEYRCDQNSMYMSFDVYMVNRVIDLNGQDDEEEMLLLRPPGNSEKANLAYEWKRTSIRPAPNAQPLDNLDVKLLTLTAPLTLYTVSNKNSAGILKKNDFGGIVSVLISDRTEICYSVVENFIRGLQHFWSQIQVHDIVLWTSTTSLNHGYTIRVRGTGADMCMNRSPTNGLPKHKNDYMRTYFCIEDTKSGHQCSQRCGKKDMKTENRINGPCGLFRVYFELPYRVQDLLLDPRYILYLVQHNVELSHVQAQQAQSQEAPTTLVKKRQVMSKKPGVSSEEKLRVLERLKLKCAETGMFDKNLPKLLPDDHYLRQEKKQQKKWADKQQQRQEQQPIISSSSSSTLKVDILTQALNQFCASSSSSSSSPGSSPSPQPPRMTTLTSPPNNSPSNKYIGTSEDMIAAKQNRLKKEASELMFDIQKIKPSSSSSTTI